MVDRVWSRCTKCRPCLEFVIPVLDPSRLRSHEILVVDRLGTFPNAVWSTEIRDPASGGNSGAGKDHDTVRGSEVSGQPLQLSGHHREFRHSVWIPPHSRDLTNQGDGLLIE